MAMCPSSEPNDLSWYRRRTNTSSFTRPLPRRCSAATRRWALNVSMVTYRNSARSFQRTRLATPTWSYSSKYASTHSTIVISFIFTSNINTFTTHSLDLLSLSLQRLALERNDPNRFLTATKDANKAKNRYVNVLPCKLNSNNGRRVTTVFG